MPDALANIPDGVEAKPAFFLPPHLAKKLEHYCPKCEVGEHYTLTEALGQTCWLCGGPYTQGRLKAAGAYDIPEDLRNVTHNNEGTFERPEEDSNGR